MAEAMITPTNSSSPLRGENSDLTGCASNPSITLSVKFLDGVSSVALRIKNDRTDCNSSNRVFNIVEPLISASRFIFWSTSNSPSK